MRPWQQALEELPSGQMELQIQKWRNGKGAEVGGKKSVGLEFGYFSKGNEM